MIGLEKKFGRSTVARIFPEARLAKARHGQQRRLGADSILDTYLKGGTPVISMTHSIDTQSLVIMGVSVLAAGLLIKHL